MQQVISAHRYEMEVRVSHGGLTSFLTRIFTLLLVVTALLTQPAYGNPKYSAIVIDADTNQVLHEAEADDIRHPASLTKMMTLYLTFEALKQGRLRTSQQLPVSAHAASMPQTNLSLRPGDKIDVETAIKSLVVRSANDVSVVLAEELGKTEWQFAVMMTNKARQLGMKQTVFRNANGLPDVRQVTTARDLAKLSLALRRDFPQYYPYFKVEEFTYKGRTYYTHNRVMRDYPGADGLKTGYINMSGFNLATSVRRDGYSIVAVVMGGKTARSRDDHMKDLLNRSLRQLAQSRPNGKGATTYAEAASEKKAPIPTFKPGTEPAEERVATSAQPQGIGDASFAVEAAAASAYAPTKNPGVDRGKWGIQVGAFSESRDAFMAAVNAMNIANRELEGSEIAVLKPQAGEGNIYRARIANMSESQARRACRVLVARKEACFVFQNDNNS